MDLFPQDLWDRHHAEIILRRSWSGHSKQSMENMGMAVAEAPPPHMGFLGKIWARGMKDLTPEQAAAGLPAASMQTSAAVWLPGTLGGMLATFVGFILAKKGILPTGEAMGGAVAVSAALSYLGAIPWGRATFRGLYKKPLTLTEVESLSSENDDAVRRAYLSLLRDAVRQTVPDSVAPELRAAIRALGAAIDRLPTVVANPIDVAALRREASALDAQAQAEPDRVTAESIERRADALRLRADANERSALLVRRTHALRAEIEAQIEALREGLAAFYPGSDVEDVSGLAHLSESARRVASEAVSVAAARTELDAPQTLLVGKAR